MNSGSFNPSSNRDNLLTSRFSYTDWRERFILAILRITCVVAIPMIVLSFPTASISDRILFIGLYVGLVAITLLQIPYPVRVYALLLMPFIVGVNAVLAWGPWADGSIFLLTCIVLSSLLLDRRADIIILGISILFTVVIAISQQTGLYRLSATTVPAITPADWFIYNIDLAIAGILLVTALGQFKDAFVKVVTDMQRAFDELAAERAQLEGKVRERTNELENQTAQLRTASVVAKSMAEVQNITELLDTVTQLTSEKFGYYHVGLYILDEQKKTIFLQSASSVTGKQLIGQGFRVESDRRNPINLVLSQNRPIISSDADSSNFVRDASFPLTRSRMILPLAVHGNILGILDLHSDQTRAFSIQDAEILQTLADLVAISFDNTRLLNETKSLLSQLEINTTIQTERTWKKLTSRQRPAYQYTPAGVRPIFSTNKTDAQEGLQVPLMLHGQKIGTINLQRKGGISHWSERERVLVEKIADQIALALENSRLVDEAQKSALRDQMIANISTRVRETLDIESVVRTAATELRKVFDLKEAEISVGSPQIESAVQVRKNTGSLRLK
ncbi:MAG: GAF domain-containing protein [Anaerolineales bacterium]|nr:GAF domain-containing protein [Anaerolineales bacterium]